MRRRRAPVDLFPVNVWPPFVDAVVLVLAAFVLLTIVAFAAQQALQKRVREGDRALQSLRADKERIERHLRALAPSGTIEIEEGKVILQGEVLFDSGSDALRPEGRLFLERIGPKLETLLEAEPGQMVFVGGHTDDRALRGNAPFASNWDLSAARADSPEQPNAVLDELVHLGEDVERLLASSQRAAAATGVATHEAES